MPDLSTGLAKIAATSVLVTGLIFGLAVLKMTGGALLKFGGLVIAAGLLVLAFFLFSADQKTKVVVNRDCAVLVSTVKQGLQDKLLREGDLKSARAIAKSLVRQIDASPCGKQ